MPVVGTYFNDADKSRAELTRVVDAMASGGRITATDAAFAKADIDAAYATADAAAYFGTDAATFWSDLGQRINGHVASYAAWGGGKKGSSGLSPGQAYTETVLSGLTALNSAKATEYRNSWAAFYEDVVEQSAEDLLQGLKDTKEKLENPWWIGAAAVLVVGIIILQGRR
jgi:hypothetical protein